MKPIEYLRILWLSFLVRLSILNLWALRLLRPLQLRRFRAMWLVLILCSCFMLALSFFPASVARADTFTVTPSPTFHSLFPSATPGPGIFSCPLGTPIGYGTVTPDAAWELLCAQCLGTSTLQFTSTAVQNNLTQTAVALTGTVTPSPTVTPSVTPSPVVTANPAFYLDFGGHWFGGYNTPYIIYAPTMTHTQVNAATIKFDGSVAVTDNSEVFAGSFYFENFAVAYGGGCWYTYTFYYSFSGDNDLALYNGGTLLGTGSVSGSFQSMAWSCGGGAADLYVRYEDPGPANMPGTYAKVYTLTISMAPIAPPVTPTPTPGSSYCSAVADGGGAGGDPFILPDITGGEPVCSNGVGGFIIPFSWFGIIGIDLPDLVVPKLTVCYIPTSFGHIVLAYNDIDLDAIAFIMGALILFMLVL